jgi:hypothetical protein
MMLFLPPRKIKCLSLHPLISSLNLFFICPSHLSLFGSFTLLIPEGRAGIAWELSNKMMLFLPPRKIKCLSLHPLISSLNLLFIYTSHLSLSLGIKGSADGTIVTKVSLSQNDRTGIPVSASSIPALRTHTATDWFYDKHKTLSYGKNRSISSHYSTIVK